MYDKIHYKEKKKKEKNKNKNTIGTEIHRHYVTKLPKFEINICETNISTLSSSIAHPSFYKSQKQRSI